VVLIALPLSGGERAGHQIQAEELTMSSPEHPYAESIPPEYAILLLIAVAVTAMALTLPWW
jgi:hypothetical protein